MNKIHAGHKTPQQYAAMRYTDPLDKAWQKMMDAKAKRDNEKARRANRQLALELDHYQVSEQH